MLPWFSDEILVNWVKGRYSPDSRWKDKPFDERDAVFFSRGLVELSERFTSGRSAKQIDYLSHPRYRSSYLLYFLPLGIQKFDTLFLQYPHAIQSALSQARKEGVLRVTDLGAGPGTGSFALLLHLLDQYKKELPPRVEFHWVDVQGAVMKDGEQLMKKLLESLPGGCAMEVKIQMTVSPWLKAIHQISDFHLGLMGQVLNEGAKSEQVVDAVARLLQNSSGGGLLMVEPADRFSSQYLSQFRDSLLNQRDDAFLIGPCLHRGKCPLSLGRDWCHFSVPVDPRQAGKWFLKFSKSLGSVREWSKYSYLWWAAPGEKIPKHDSEVRLVVSDPLDRKWVLVCEPERVRRHPVHPSQLKKIRRGEQIRLAPSREPAAIQAGLKLKKRRV